MQRRDCGRRHVQTDLSCPSPIRHAGPHTRRAEAWSLTPSGVVLSPKSLRRASCAGNPFSDCKLSSFLHSLFLTRLHADGHLKQLVFNKGMLAPQMWRCHGGGMPVVIGNVP